jgi:hypothetical protein
MFKGILAVMIDIFIFGYMIYFSVVNSGTVSGWLMTIATVAWGILVLNALKNIRFMS